MRLARTIGTVTLVEPHASMRGGALRLLVPLGPDDLAAGDGGAEPLVAWDDLGAGDGQGGHVGIHRLVGGPERLGRLAPLAEGDDLRILGSPGMEA